MRRWLEELGLLREVAPFEDRYQFEADGMPRAQLNRDLRVVRANAALVRMLGRAPDTLADILSHEAGALPAQAIASAIARSIAPGPIATLCRSAGGPLAVQLWVAPAGSDAAVLSIVPEPTADPEEIQARRLQAVGALAAGVAHDFNNLLQAIIGAAEALAERSDADDEETAIILAGARRAAGVVAQLLAFSRQQTLQPRVVAVNRAVSALVALLRGSQWERVNVVLDLEEPGRTVRIDAGQLDQVILNLAMNARAAMPQGGTLTLRTRRENLLTPRVSGGETIPPGRYLAIEVVDTGVGIPADVIGSIFEPFFTTREVGGTGLGLATVLGIVRQSGGFLEVASKLGQGSLFRVLLPRLPLSEVEPAPATVPVASSPVDMRGVVLLVEDEEPVRRLAERALQRQGWEVRAAGSAEDALQIVDGNQPLSCIVTDMMMPGMDGVELIHEVRRRKGHVPAVIVSGYAEVPRHSAMESSATAFLAKPHTMRDLVALVGKVAG